MTIQQIPGGLDYERAHRATREKHWVALAERTRRMGDEAPRIAAAIAELDGLYPTGRLIMGQADIGCYVGWGSWFALSDDRGYNVLSAHFNGSTAEEAAEKAAAYVRDFHAERGPDAAGRL